MKNNKFGHIFRSLRESKGLTLPQVAQKARLSKSTVSKFENGKGDIQLSTLCKLFKQVDCSICWTANPDNSTTFY